VRYTVSTDALRHVVRRRTGYKWAEKLSFHPNAKRVIVAPTDTTYGLARLYDTETYKQDSIVVPTITEAAAELGMDVADTDTSFPVYPCHRSITGRDCYQHHRCYISCAAACPLSTYKAFVVYPVHFPQTVSHLPDGASALLLESSRSLLGRVKLHPAIALCSGRCRSVVLRQGDGARSVDAVN
jgi:hypothetical protein